LEMSGFIDVLSVQAQPYGTAVASGQWRPEVWFRPVSDWAKVEIWLSGT
jgi:hypothetical protein